MRNLPLALLASAAIALPLAAAHAQTPAPGIVLYDAAGAPVAVLRPLAAPSPAADPAFAMIREMQAAMRPDFFPVDFFARQDAMLRQVMQQMGRLAAQPMPAPGTIEAALGAAPGTASQVVVTAFSSGNGSCSETVSYSYPGNGAAPQVAVRKVGDACGAMPSLHTVPTAEPAAPEQAVPRPAAPDRTRLIRVDYRHAADAAGRLHG